jgi:hypothetical protein
MYFSLHFRRIVPLYPLQRHDNDDAADMTEPFAALSGNSRASRVAIVSIQRHTPSHPPVISAEVLHKLQ